MVKLATFSIKGIKRTSKNLPKDWEEKENDYLLAQAIRIYEAKMHKGLSKVKTRGEVRGSTRKIYRQKGTGGARHGDRYAPIFVGGGVAHGPTGVKRQLELPRKLRKRALKIVLTSLAKEGKLIVVEQIEMLKGTKDAAAFLKKLMSSQKEIKPGGRFTFVLSEKNKDAAKFIRNLRNSRVASFKDINAYTAYFGGVLVIDSKVLAKGRPTSASKKTVAKKGAIKTSTRKIKRNKK